MPSPVRPTLQQLQAQQRDYGAESQASSYASSGYPPPPRQQEMEQMYADEAQYWANKATLTSQDFFGRLPAQPVIPLRIEPRDVIVEGEDLTRIRNKFKEMADEAQRNSKGSQLAFIDIS